MTTRGVVLRNTRLKPKKTAANLHLHVVLGRNVSVFFVVMDDHVNSGRTEAKPRHQRVQ